MSTNIVYADIYVIIVKNRSQIADMIFLRTPKYLFNSNELPYLTAIC